METDTRFTARQGRGQARRGPQALQALITALLLSTTALAPAFGQVTQSNPPAEVKVALTDPLGRDTPRGTVVGFISAATEGNVQRAALYLDARSLSSQLEERVQQLLAVLNHTLSPSDLENLSREPAGNVEDSPQPRVEVVGEFRSGEYSLKITLERIDRKDETPIWRFTSATLKGIPDAAQHIGMSWQEHLAWKPLREIHFLSLPLWQWLAIPIALTFVFAFATILSRGVVAVLRRLLARLTGARAEAPLARITGPMRLISLGVAIAAWVAVSALPLLARVQLSRVAATVAIVGSAWLVVRLMDIAKHVFEARFLRQNELGSTSVVQLTSSLGKVLVIIVAIMGVLYAVGFDLTTALAGLGIGGVAIAFAAQKSLENVFGGVLIISDQPVRVGDFCRAGDVMGTIEQIGVRSTRIRTLDRTVVSIPNAQMASMNLENFGQRDKFWFRPVLGLRYETQADQLRYVLAEIRRMFYEHPRVENDSARVRFVRFGTSSLDLDVFAYVRAGDFADFLAVQEDLLLRIMDIVKDGGTGFAFPSSTTYLARDSGLDGKKTEDAVAAVGRWRDEQELPFPNFRASRIAEFDSKLEYPPRESDLRGSDKPK
jgi:MscS family membrane protein